ncbi:ThuA domain-containing protein, partial [Streptomyces sp. NPDC057052]|uniref:ThuA domain-containing protein n=1 Tax=Streptomyces sp. NPDC057052 TaxID=3346010 RepID=UPI00363E7C4F
MRLRGLSTTRVSGARRAGRRRRRARVAAVAAGAVTAGLLSGPAVQARPAPEPPLTTMSVKSPPGGPGVNVLVFHGSAAAGEESPVVDAGIEAIEDIGLTGAADQRFEVEATDDASVFADGARLGGYNAVVFLTGGGDVLDPEQEAGLEAYMGAVSYTH